MNAPTDVTLPPIAPRGRVVNPTLSAPQWGLLLALSALWGGSFFFIGVAVRELPPFTLVLGRVAIAAVALLLYVHLRGGHMPRSLRVWRSFLVMGALNGLIPYSLIVWGQTQIESGVAAILNGTTPLFSVLLVPLLTRDERLTPLRLGGVALGVGGLSVMIGVGALHGLGGEVLGQWAVVGAAFSYALAAIYGRRFRGMAPPVAAAGQITGTTLLVLPVALLLDQPWTLAPTAVTWLALLALALLSTAVGYLIYFRLLATAGATNLLLVTLLMPVSALALGVALLGERPDWTAYAGMGLIVSGIVAVDGRLPAGMARRWQRNRGRHRARPAAG